MLTQTLSSEENRSRDAELEANQAKIRQKMGQMEKGFEAGLDGLHAEVAGAVIGSSTEPDPIPIPNRNWHGKVAGELKATEGDENEVQGPLSQQLMKQIGQANGIAEVGLGFMGLAFDCDTFNQG